MFDTSLNASSSGCEDRQTYTDMYSSVIQARGKERDIGWCWGNFREELLVAGCESETLVYNDCYVYEGKFPNSKCFNLIRYAD